MLEARPPLSGALSALVEGEGERLTLDQALAALGDRSFAGVILVLTLVSWALPPGLSAVPGAPLALVGGQLLLGAGAPWVPHVLRRSSLDRARARRLVARTRPMVERVERVLRPRLPALSRPPHVRWVGLGCALLATPMVVPIPFAHSTAGFGLLAFAVGLLTGDGLALLAGWVLTVGCGGVLAALAFAAHWGFHQF